MKTAVALVLVIMVSVQTPFGQLLKLPILVTHFMKHQQEEGLGLMGFLEEHYQADHQDEDLPEDERLPFKSITCYTIGSAIMPAMVKTNSVPCLPACKKIIFRETYTPQQYSGNIFHPPRV